MMKYKNAKNLLPDWLLSKVQDYVQGEIVYIPKPQRDRSGWGAVNGTREKYWERNHEILNFYRNGITIHELSQKYNLSDDSIRKIVRGNRERVQLFENQEVGSEPVGSREFAKRMCQVQK